MTKAASAAGRGVHVPKRMCTASRSRGPKEDLLRFVKGPDGLVHFDPSGKAEGRGAYVKLDTEALRAALRKHVVARNLEARHNEHLEREVISQLESRYFKALGLARKRGALVTGLDKVAETLKKQGLSAIFIAEDAGHDVCSRAAQWRERNENVFVLGTREHFEEALGVPNCTVIGLAEEKGAEPICLAARRLALVKGQSAK